MGIHSKYSLAASAAKGLLRQARILGHRSKVAPAEWMAGSFETASENWTGFFLLQMEAMVYCTGKFSVETPGAQNIKGG